MKVIECRNLDIRRGSCLVLSDLNLDIENNQFIGIFGPNGAGKTTFMKAVLGVIPTYRGYLSILGKSAKHAQKDIGYIPQYRDIQSFRLNGRDFVASSVRGHQWGLSFLTKNDFKNVDEALSQVQARDLANIPLNEMSGGQRQRLLLAQALLGNPKILILDEPFSNLDPKWVKVILSLIKEIQEQRQLTILLSTHDLNPLIHVMDQVLCIGNQHAVLGSVDDVMTSSVLTKLYGFPLQVVKADQHIFVTSS
ncbi:metal ABC transporter ATP-binding protein [Commensalibacter oyaizuii]|uniref:Metal ABC transporter ATP-binding protein n=1 Tax=Commensalibacter oyaizuii TaxID=3043873 RepID=A0ABT6Q2C9_9PROT|nr:metal ABC transporter ATP-binding protein [Commensalibacter sp. TBRC 16381]MDI2091180.1 metal ABC transporter ATP-binding protein [Commensalibacter sp. TBRC 16381]